MRRRDALGLLGMPLVGPLVGQGRTLEVVADFEGGSAGAVEVVSGSHLRVAVKGQADQDGRNRQANWYYFEVRNAKPGEELRIDLVNLPGEYDYKPNRGAVTADTRPYVQDGTEWREADGAYDAEQPKWTLRIRPKGERIRIAHVHPYLASDLARLKDEVKPRVEVIGKSIGGRDLELWTVEQDCTGNSPVVWLMFRQHAWETGTSWTGQGMVRSLPRGVVWKILPLCDPDGVAEGGVRFNKRGFDLNRNWDAAVDVAARPEIAAQRKAIESWLESGKRIDLFLTLHDTETSEYLEGPPEGKAALLGRRLWTTLKAESSFDPSREYFSRMEIPAPGRANVIQWLWNQHKVPAFLMELRVARSAKLGARPTAASWEKFGRELAQGIVAELGMVAPKYQERPVFSSEELSAWTRQQFKGASEIWIGRGDATYVGRHLHFSDDGLSLIGRVDATRKQFRWEEIDQICWWQGKFGGKPVGLLKGMAVAPYEFGVGMATGKPHKAAMNAAYAPLLMANNSSVGRFFRAVRRREK